MPELIRIKRRTFRIVTILLYAVFLTLIAYTFTPQFLTPKPGEKSFRCTASQLYVGLARAAGQNCTTKCTNWEAADCSGYSSCYNKNISCTNGVDQNGRSCQGCCYDCEVVCEPDPDQPPSISGSVSCGQMGKNGWCIQSARLDISASDPQGYSLSVSGNASGAFSCNGNCSIDLPTGSGVADYVVTASQSGLSASGSADWSFDPESPNIGLDVSGSSGQNGWYRSSVTITPKGSDSISGLAGAFVSVNNGAWQTSATLSDGKHSVIVTAADYAGNTADSSATLFVDTVTPSISVSINGSGTKSGWFASDTTVSASASDATSGIASVDVRVDGGSYRPYSSSVVFSNGSHTVQFRATDKAGNSTESPVKDILIDLNSPSVNLLTTDLNSGIITYKLHDGESGLASVYMTIENKNGKYPKVSWSKKVSGKNINDAYQWDGKLPGETILHSGEYVVWLKAVDQAGNQETQVISITISETGSFTASSQDPVLQKDGSIPPVEFNEDGNLSTQSNASDLSYGGTASEVSEVESTSLTLSVGEASGVNHPPFPWGLVTMSTTIAAGAATYVATKSKKSAAQKKETRARLLAELEAKWDAKARIADAIRGRGITNKIARLEAKEVIQQQKEKQAKKQLIAQEKQKKKKAAEEKAGLAALYNARKQGEQDAAVSAPPKEKPWWEKTIDYVDQHQVEISLGVGLVVGVAAIVLSGGIAAPLVAAAWVSGAAVVAGGTIALGTAALNSHYGREWNENLGRNTLLAGLAAVVVSGGWFLLQGAIATTGAFCAAPSNPCARVEPILNAIDTIEEASLNVKLAYQTWKGDPNAADTALELQMEHMDGGMPGNTAAREVADLGDDAAELISLYGDDAIPLLLKYGDDAVDIIGAYGDDGIKLLQKYGWESVELIQKHGTPAVKLMEAVNPNSAQKLLEALDDDVLDYAIKQGSDSISALSHWSTDELLKYGDELALRAKTDAKALDAARKLAKIKDLNSPEAKELLKIIAQNSIQGNSDRIVLGKWVAGNFDDGFIGVARSSGSYFYGPNPGLENAFKEVDPSIRDEYLWAVNQQALQEAVDLDMTIDYSFDGLPLSDISTEITAIEAITKGASKSDVEKIMKRTFPFRMREIQYLVDQGYTMVIDETNEIIHWVKP